MSDYAYEDLIPEEVASSVIEAVRHESAVLSLGRSVIIPKGVLKLPVVSFAPQAGFISAHGGRKPITRIEWTVEQITPEEIAAVLAIPADFLGDSGFPVWENVQPAVASALAYALDMAVLWGDGAPAAFPADGVAGFAGEVVEGETTLLAVSEAMAKVEDTGLIPTGHATGPGSGRFLRNLKDENGNLVYLAGITAGAPATLYDLPVSKTLAWPTAGGASVGEGDLITGDWTKLVLGVREDIRFTLSTDGVLTDDDGIVVANAFQDDLVLMRCYMRVGAAIGQPVNVKNETTEPFAICSLTPTGGEGVIGIAAKPKAKAKA